MITHCRRAGQGHKPAGHNNDLTSVKKRLRNMKYTPKKAARKAKNAATTRTEQNNPPAGWIENDSFILPCAKLSAEVVIPHVGQGKPYFCLNPHGSVHLPISTLPAPASRANTKKPTTHNKTIAAATRWRNDAR
jgi:hypothetical protein